MTITLTSVVVVTGVPSESMKEKFCRPIRAKQVIAVAPIKRHLIKVLTNPLRSSDLLTMPLSMIASFGSSGEDFSNNILTRSRAVKFLRRSETNVKMVIDS